MKINIIKKIKLKGFTLIEIMLITGFISIASISAYVIYKKTSQTSSSNREAENLHNLIKRIEGGVVTTGSFSGITEQTLGNYGSGFASNFNLATINSPNSSTLNFNYIDLNSDVCTKFVNAMIVSRGDVKAIVNSRDIPQGTNPEITADSCKNDTNQVTIQINSKISNLGITVVPTPVAVITAPPFIMAYLVPPAPSPTPTPAPTPAPSPTPAPITGRWKLIKQTLPLYITYPDGTTMVYMNTNLESIMCPVNMALIDPKVGDACNPQLYTNSLDLCSNGRVTGSQQGGQVTYIVTDALVCRNPN